jgi:hypothetical protein
MAHTLDSIMKDLRDTQKQLLMVKSRHNQAKINYCRTRLCELKREYENANITYLSLAEAGLRPLRSSHRHMHRSQLFVCRALPGASFAETRVSCSAGTSNLSPLSGHVIGLCGKLRHPATPGYHHQDKLTHFCSPVGQSKNPISIYGNIIIKNASNPFVPKLKVLIEKKKPRLEVSTQDIKEITSTKLVNKNVWR